MGGRCATTKAPLRSRRRSTADPIWNCSAHRLSAGGRDTKRALYTRHHVGLMDRTYSWVGWGAEDGSASHLPYPSPHKFMGLPALVGLASRSCAYSHT